MFIRVSHITKTEADKQAGRQAGRLCQHAECDLNISLRGGCQIMRDCYLFFATRQKSERRVANEPTNCFLPSAAKMLRKKWVLFGISGNFIWNSVKKVEEFSPEFNEKNSSAVVFKALIIHISRISSPFSLLWWFFVVWVHPWGEKGGIFHRIISIPLDRVIRII